MVNFKKLFFLGFFSAVLMAFFTSCIAASSEKKIIPDINEARKKYGDQLVLSPLDDSVKISKNQIVLSPVEEGVTYTFSGYFDGQIVNTTKNTVIKLKDAFIENKMGKPAISSETKVEVAVSKESENFIISRGRNYSRSAALRSKRGLVIGGGGKLYVKGKICHGVEAEDVKLKGSGQFYFAGTKKGSAVNCETFLVDEEKTFNAYFVNSKNGIKADRTISISSGNFHFINDTTGLKTDTSQEKPGKAHAIILNGGKILSYSLNTLYKTDENAFINAGAEILSVDDRNDFVENLENPEKEAVNE